MLLTRSLSSAIREAFRADFTSGFLDPRINFSRTTNATVTNSAGLITYAPMNLLIYSEQFDNAAWSKGNVTIIANNTSAPNGYQTADYVESTIAAQTYFRQTSTVANATTYTQSIYAKKGTVNWLKIEMGWAGFKFANFDLNTGVVGTLSADVTAIITDEGNGWYRCTATATSTSTSGFTQFNVTSSDNTIPTASGQGIFFWGAQLEVGSTATTYNPTTVKNLLGYSELFDNASWTKSNSFVQTNLLTYSEAFDNAAWTAARVTFSANSAIAPNGYQTADKLIETATTGLHNVQQILTVTSGATYTLSIYAKAAERTILEVIDPYTLTGATFDLVNGTTGNPQTGGVTLATNRGIEPAANGFYRCYIRVTTAGTSLAMRAGLSDGSATSYTGNGTSGLIYWGAQIVGGSLAGDYRRTDAAALPVYYANHNGVVCAEKLVETTAASTTHGLTQAVTTSGSANTISVYAKAGERNWVLVGDSTVASARAWFNLSTGVKGTLGIGATSSTIEAVGNGYYRCSVTLTTTAASNTFYIYSATADGAATYTGDGTSGIYIFGAQLSDSASLDPYVLNAAAAPTAAAYYGARFDYDPVTLAPKGLLIEEQRSNLLLQSEAFNTTWTLTGCKAFGSGSTVNATTSPDGTVSADLITPTAGSAHYVIQTATVASGAAYTTTIYAKPAGYTWILLWSNTASAGAYFDVANGVIGTVSSGVTATITKVANGFYRCSITRTTASTSEVVACFVAQSNGVFSYTSDETSGMYLWGAQLEAGAFATSYIPTAASQVTRAADVATIQGSNFYSWYNQNEGTLFGQGQSLTNASALRLLSSSDGTASNFIALRNTTASGFSGQIAVSSIDQVSFGAGDVSGVFYKKALAYKLNDVAFSSNNSTPSTDTTVNIPLVNQMAIGFASSAYGSGYIKSISYYPQRLSDSVLKGLTA